jgi:hypothetical protein
MAEPGVKLFLPNRSPTKPSLFFIFELYANEAGWKAHETTDQFKIAIAELLPRLPSYRSSRVDRRKQPNFASRSPLITPQAFAPVARRQSQGRMGLALGTAAAVA